MPRGNPQNLKVPTSEEAQKNGKAGGIASGKARAKRKALKEELLALLEDGDTQKSVAVALINEAINGNNAGSVKGAFETIRDTIGEKPVEKVVTAQVDPSVIADVESMVKDAIDEETSD